MTHFNCLILMIIIQLSDFYDLFSDHTSHSNDKQLNYMLKSSYCHIDQFQVFSLHHLQIIILLDQNLIFFKLHMKKGSHSIDYKVSFKKIFFFIICYQKIHHHAFVYLNALLLTGFIFLFLVDFMSFYIFQKRSLMKHFEKYNIEVIFIIYGFFFLNHNFNSI